MRKIYFVRGEACPYGLKTNSLKDWKYNLYNDSIIHFAGACPDCKYHVKKVWLDENKGYVLCNHPLPFNSKIKIVKGLLNEKD